MAEIPQRILKALFLTYDGEGAKDPALSHSKAQIFDPSVHTEVPPERKSISLRLVLLHQPPQAAGQEVKHWPTEADRHTKDDPDTGTDERGASHPSLSTVREEIRFSLQPVSIRTFTSRPKHWEEEKEEEEVVLQGGKTACFPNYLELSKHNNLAGNVNQIPLFLFFFFVWVEMIHGQKNSSSSFSRWQAHPSSGQLGLQQPLL